MNKKSPLLFCHDLHKSFHEGSVELPVLNGIDLTLERGECAAITGVSGCGKTTLLQILGSVDLPTQGEVFLEGQNIALLTEKQKGRLRNQKLGFVFQFHHLLPEFTALENVCLPLLMRGRSPTWAEKKARDVLTHVHLEYRIHHTPAELSGGERQRVAIARALVTEPVCVLADEPTGNLDRKTAEDVFALMINLNQTTKTALLIATHDLQMAQKMDKVYSLVNGKLV